ncbi:sigma-70 family RNA polymerase sigma factor [Streptomyces xanthophaeus]|uniref:sigma-70 family RNA polymerase sigma factor n=1 Tax=Streptomyces xanthophaeus TaxID=67385 RepID=UPI0038632F36|nr:sigma-70 family RNA polymerase sigma factor [Streptomyces xanthophaeus]WST63839.1 sigma-70 family RNA polymerase sigma factor [Streptomyces xanthophaeus]
MDGEQSGTGTPGAPGALTEDQAGRMLAGMNEVIRAGEEMRQLRAEMIKVLAGLGWTQERIARIAGMSQPAVSKQVVKYQAGAPLPQVGLALDQGDGAWLEGRLWGLAEELAEVLSGSPHGPAACARRIDALARGRERFTPQTVDALRRLVEEDLRRHRAELPAGYRGAYDRISRGLDVPAPAAAAAVAGPPAVRRALARQLQRDGLREAQGPGDSA